MSKALSIGDFSVMTHLNKTPRYYHQVGLLEPAQVALVLPLTK